MELNENIEVMGVEAIGKSRILLALKGTNLNAEQAVCLQVMLEDGVVYPTHKLDLITNATTFNAYNFIDDFDQRENYTLLIKRMLAYEAVDAINKLFEPNSNKM